MIRLCILILPLILGAATTLGEKYLGAAYVNDPLGEGVAPDTDPLIRFDAFDCTTFVETVLADGDVDKLTKIRYKNGNVGFVNRNHFIETDWLSNNSDLVKNVSARYAKTSTRTINVNRSAWLKHVHNVSVRPQSRTANLEYIPYEKLDHIKSNTPLVVLFVLRNNPDTVKKLGTDLAVGHMGFLLPNGMLRHASSTAGRVVDVKFDEYVAKRKKMPNNIGIALLEIKQK